MGKLDWRPGSFPINGPVAVQQVDHDAVAAEFSAHLIVNLHDLEFGVAVQEVGEPGDQRSA